MDLAGSEVNHPFIDDGPVRGEEVERDRSSAPVGGVRAINIYQRSPVAMPQRQECVEQPARQTQHALVDRFHPDSREVL